MSATKKINWQLCCLCQTNKSGVPLRTFKDEGRRSLEKDLEDFNKLDSNKLPSGINVKIGQLNDGSGIAATLEGHDARYHKTCRCYCSSSRLKRERDKMEDPNSPQYGRRKLRSFKESHHQTRWCIICEREDQANLHRIVNDAVNDNLKCWAQQSKKFDLLGRLIAKSSDTLASQTFYHHLCYLQLRHSAVAETRRESVDPFESEPFDPIVCAQIVAIVENSDNTIFRLSELREMYRTLMKEQGRPLPDTRTPHSTRFKTYLLDLLPEWDEYSKGDVRRAGIFLTRKGQVFDELSKSYKSKIEQREALTFMRAALMMRKFCLQSQEPFNGSFPPNSTSAPVNKEMRAFFNIVLQGTPVLHRSRENEEDSNARDVIACNISQLLIYNTCGGSHHEVKTTAIRHKKERETPFALYRGLKLHGQGRSKKLIDEEHDQGMCVSYKRVMELKRQVARAVCTRHARDGVIVPTNSRSNVFTTHDVDNLDNKAQGNLSIDEFHGYALSVTNHLSRGNEGSKRDPIKLDPCDTSIPKLPDKYLVHKPVNLCQTDIFVPKMEGKELRPNHDMKNACSRNDEWMAHVAEVLRKETLEDGDIIAWSGYHSSLSSDESVKPSAVIGVYPLFPEKAASASSMKHAMELTMQGTEFLNPGQTSVLGADQPLYAIIKHIQWQFPESLGEDKLVAMMGALHIEDKMHLMAGKLLRDSGWAAVLSQAEILTSGRAQSTLNEHHIKRTRYAHQVSLASLYILRQNAYSQYVDSTMGPHESFSMWNERSSSVPQFNFWSMIINVELLMAQFVQSLREGNFALYVQSCDQLCGWFHVLDHTNYARWLPVHVRDMVTLADRHPEVYAEFVNGNFVVQRSSKKFSLMAKDQSHEQSNKLLQGHGGAVGLYESPEALSLFMLAGADCARIVQEFEMMNDSMSSSNDHHEKARSFQLKFRKDVLSFVGVVEQMGNPFLSQSHELYALDTQDVMEPEVAASLCQLSRIGQAHHASYVNERLVNTSTPITDTIQRHNMLTFSNRPNMKGGKKDGKCCAQKQNLALVTQLFLSFQSRSDANIADFFCYENQKEPPSLSDRGSLRSGTKSRIIECLQVSNESTEAIKLATVVICDMAAVVHLVRPTLAKTFMEYVQQSIIPFLRAHCQTNTERIDAVWDTYPEENNLKAITQKKRGNGPRTRVGDGSTRIPKREWCSGFLKNEKNKQELFSFISREISKVDLGGKLLVSTHLETVLSNKDCDLAQLHPCNHAEADSRIFLHLCHAVQQGHTSAYIRTVDSDVVVLAVRFFNTLGLSELWVGIGSGKHYRDIPVHVVSANLGPSKSLALPLFHSLTGCDTTSYFLGCGKKTAWAAWANIPELTDTLVALSECPDLFTVDSVHMKRIERFVVLMYSKGCGVDSVNDARHRLFTTGQKLLEHIPPTQAALYQHARRAILQASFYWSQSTVAQQTIPHFSDWGWCKDNKGTWQPFWTCLSDASKACSLLLRCTCRKACRGRCKCNGAGVRCTVLCKCEGGCTNSQERHEL